MNARIRKTALLLIVLCVLAGACLQLGACGLRKTDRGWTVSEFVIPSGYDVSAVRGFDPEAGTVTVFAYRYADGTPCLLTAEEDGLIRARTALPGAERLMGLTWLPDGGFMGIREIDGEQIAERYGPDGSLTGSFSADCLLAPFLSGTEETSGEISRRKKERIGMRSDGRGGLIFQAASALYFYPGPADSLFDGGEGALLSDAIRPLPLPDGIRSDDLPLVSPDGTLFVRWLGAGGQRGAFFDPETREALCVFPLPWRTRILGFDGAGRLLFTEGGGVLAVTPGENPAPAVHVLDRTGLKLPRNPSVCLLPAESGTGEASVALFWESAKDPEAARRRDGESDGAYSARTAALPRQTRILIFTPAP